MACCAALRSNAEHERCPAVGLQTGANQGRSDVCRVILWVLKSMGDVYALAGTQLQT